LDKKGLKYKFADPEDITDVALQILKGKKAKKKAKKKAGKKK
jgi:hypothetical protein